MTDTTTPTPLFARTIAAALPLLARLTFAAVLLRYYWGSALTKVGEGPLGLQRRRVTLARPVPDKQQHARNQGRRERGAPPSRGPVGVGARFSSGTLDKAFPDSNPHALRRGAFGQFAQTRRHLVEPGVPVVHPDTPSPFAAAN